MKITTIATIVLAVLLLSPSAAGHGGGLDRNGCHTNRKTGEYHCHGGAPPAAPAPAARSAAPAIRPASTERLTIHSLPTTSGRDLVRAAQVMLRALGHSPTVLGEMDERTRAAVRAFQRAENLNGDGVITEYLVLRLAEKLAAKCD